MSAAILCPADSVSDVMDKADMRATSVRNVMSQPFLLFVGIERIKWLRAKLQFQVLRKVLESNRYNKADFTSLWKPYSFNSCMLKVVEDIFLEPILYYNQ